MRDDEKKFARADRLGRFFDTRMITGIVCPDAATNLVASSSTCRTARSARVKPQARLQASAPMFLRKHQTPERTRP